MLYCVRQFVSRRTNMSSVFTILIHACFLWTHTGSESSHCNTDQILGCKNAAMDRKLDVFNEGGECSRNSYVEYTHVCSVTNYLPSADYCCCAFEQKVFCCRYHYDWNYFRCDENEDVIYTLLGTEVTDLPLPLEILVPITVLSGLILVCLTVYCIKCCCCYEEDESTSCQRLFWCSRKKYTSQDKSVQIEDPTNLMDDKYCAASPEARKTHANVDVCTRLNCDKGDFYQSPEDRHNKPPEYSYLPPHPVVAQSYPAHLTSSARVEPTAPPMSCDMIQNTEKGMPPTQYSDTHISQHFRMPNSPIPASGENYIQFVECKKPYDSHLEDSGKPTNI